MALHTSEAILLDVRDLHDRDRIVVFLTRERGRLSGVAKGARTKHSRYAGQLQPLAKARVTWFEKEGRELVRISGVDLLRPSMKIQESLEDLLLGSYLAEHMLVFAQENEAADLLFRLLDSTLEALLAGIDRDLAARYFEVWVLRLAGVFPVPTECPSCGRAYSASLDAVLPAHGDGLVCIECSGGHSGPPPAAPPGSRLADPDVLDFLRRSGRERLVRMAEGPPDPSTLRRTEEIAARVRRTFLQAELKSYRVLRRTLGEPPGAESGQEPASGRGRLEGRSDPS